MARQTKQRDEHAPAVNAAIRESERIFPLGEAGVHDGNPHLYVNEEGVFGYGDTVGWAALDEGRAAEIAEALAGINEEDESAYEDFWAAICAFEIAGTSSW